MNESLHPHSHIIGYSQRFVLLTNVTAKSNLSAPKFIQKRLFGRHPLEFAKSKF